MVAKHHTEKVVCYVTHQGRLLVFTHMDVPLTVAGVQVPAGTIEPGETPRQAALREVWEETGLTDLIVEDVLATDHLDVSPMRAEVQHRHFVHLTTADPMGERWQAGEPDPSGGGAPHRWECWWLPLENAHVLAAAQSRFIHRLVE